MLPLINYIDESIQSVKRDFESWFQSIPPGSNWRILSDYSLDNHDKQNDAYTFVILLNHDTAENISSYIRAVAPKDLKSTRKPSAGLCRYLASPVAFSITFVVERKSQHIKAFITPEAMADNLNGMRQTAAEKANKEPQNGEYYAEIDKRLRALQNELEQRNPNLKLLRKIFLTATFAATVFRLIESKLPSSLFWITDRDAIFDRHDGAAFDMAWLLFQITRTELAYVVDVSRPKFLFASPGMDGFTEYAEFIRLPDFLAGAFSDLRLPSITFSHEKFEPIFQNLVVNSKNNAVIELITGVREGHLTTRRLVFKY